MEVILGQSSRFTFCSKMSSLTEEISLVTSDNTKVIIVSCLSGIISTLAKNQDAKTSIERAMSMFGTLLYDIHRTRQGGIKIFISPGTPRADKDFETHNKFAMVQCVNLSYFIHNFNLEMFFFQRCLADTVREIPSVSVLSWTTEYELKDDGFSLSEASQKQYLEDLLMFVRRGLERQKSPQPSTSSGSVSQFSQAPRGSSTPIRSSTPQGASTPIRPSGLSMSQNNEIDEDVRYEKFRKKFEIRKIN